MRKHETPTGITYQKFSDYTLKVLSCKKVETRRAFGAKVVIVPEESETWITENPPRGPKSSEVGRSVHSRMVRRPDGLYTLTFRFSAEENRLREQLVSEIGYQTAAAISDRKSRKEAVHA